jgi:hypothetical protein
MTDEQWSELQIILGKRHLERIFKNQRPFLEGRIEEFAAAYARRVSGTLHPGIPLTASVSDLLSEHGRNAHRVDTLLQGLAFSVSPEMLAMMWMVLMGAQIEGISYGYSRRAKSHLKVEILLPDRTTTLAFQSDEHWDSAVLKMMALSKSDGLPLVGEFSPLYVPGP